MKIADKSALTKAEWQVVGWTTLHPSTDKLPRWIDKSPSSLQQLGEAIDHQLRCFFRHRAAMVVAVADRHAGHAGGAGRQHVSARITDEQRLFLTCLLYTSDAADE